MSHDLHTYGSVEPLYFFLVDSAGNRIAGHVFVTGDVLLIVDGDADIDISAECVAVSQGCYKWTPSLASRTERQVIAIVIQDSVGTAFIDNGMIVATGNHANARF
ncbi:MAG: hypothetical protein COA54_02445 [Thiotrichaceae bacterium]|nr:MAG: hypothetical protein COA54_02445 [Thiotrichaceae bacterium]